MNGAHVETELLALVERRLAPAERARVETHLALCSRCRDAAGTLFDVVEELAVLPGALRALPTGAAQQWPAVWARLQARGAAARAGRPAWPQVSVYLSLVTSFLVFVSVLPSGGASAPASVTAGVAAGPQLTQPATVVFQAQTDTHVHRLAAAAEPTLGGTEAVQPIPIPTPVPGP